MMHLLRRHPFGVEAFFRWSLVLTYAAPATALAELAGPGLQLDTYGDWGFVAVALVQTERLRPAGLPEWLGRDFFLSGYRVFTKLVRPGKPPLRGLRILRSDTDRRTMTALGNVFTHYRYRRARVDVAMDAARLHVRVVTPSREADLDVEADLGARPAPLPEGSPFRSLDDARSFAGPLPYTFDYEEATGKMVLVKGLRRAWSPEPVAVKVREVSFLDGARFADARLANAFFLERVPYAWKRGAVEDVA